MKKYEEYMAEVKASDELCGKILRGEKPRRVRTREGIFRFATAAAGLVAIAVCVFLVSMLLGNQEPPDGLAHEPMPDGYADGSVADGDADTGDAENDANILYTAENDEREDVSLPRLAPEITRYYTVREVPLVTYPLVFNRTDASASWGGETWSNTHFSGTISDDKLSRMLPGFSLHGSVMFCENETFDYVSVHEYSVRETTTRNGIRTGWSIFSSGIQFIITHEGRTLGVLSPLDYDNATVSYVQGVAVRAFYNPEWTCCCGNYSLFAEFNLNGNFYRVESSWRNDRECFTQIVNLLIERGGADLSVFDNFEFPARWTNRLTLEEARAIPVWGGFVPNMPAIFAPGEVFIDSRGGNEFINLMWHATGFTRNALAVINIGAPHDYHNRLVSVDDYELFDIHLRAPEVSWDMWGAGGLSPNISHIFREPVFRAEEFTFDTLRARVRWYDDDFLDAYFMNINSYMRAQYRIAGFSVLFDDVMISVAGSGMTPEEIWDAIFAHLLP